MLFQKSKAYSRLMLLPPNGKLSARIAPNLLLVAVFRHASFIVILF
jgi:hypothetical protein